MFNKKRGQFKLSLWTIIELMLFVIVALLFISMIRDVQDNTLFEKTYVSRDMALMANTVQSVPGDVTVYYSQPNFDIGNFSYDFTDNLVILYNPEERTGSEVKYPFFINSNLLSSLEDLETPSHLVFVKTSELFQIREDYNEDSVEQLVCGNIQATLAGQDTLVVYSTTNNKNEIAITDYLSSDKLSFIKRSSQTTDIETNTNLVIGIEIATDNTSTTNTIKAYYPYGSNSEQSKKMACSILSELNSKFTSLNIEINQRPIQSSNAVINKNTNGMAVLLELGNDAIESDLFDDPNTLASTIQIGINNYYIEVK